MAGIGSRQSSYDLEFVGLSNQQAVYVSLTIAERELLWARTGVIQNTTNGLVNDFGTITTNFDEMSNDGILSPVEKIGLWFLFKAYSDESVALIGQADAFGVPSGTYSGYVNTMRTQMLSGITPGIAYNAAQNTLSVWMSNSSTISNVANFRGAFANVATGRGDLISALANYANNTGGDANDNANRRNRIYVGPYPPYGTYSGLQVLEGDLWFNSDTTTNCPDQNCAGHQVNTATLEPYVGNYPHSFIGRQHRFNAAGAWVDAGDRSMLSASRFPNGIITNRMVGSEIYTDNYTCVNPGTPNEYATQGVKLRRTSSGPGLLIDPRGMRVGNTTLDQTWFATQRVYGAVVAFSAGGYTFTRNTGFINPNYSGNLFSMQVPNGQAQVIVTATAAGYGPYTSGQPYEPPHIVIAQGGNGGLIIQNIGASATGPVWKQLDGLNVAVMAIELATL